VLDILRVVNVQGYRDGSGADGVRSSVREVGRLKECRGKELDDERRAFRFCGCD
jgi:hypothetical protein